MRVVFFGTPVFACASLEALINSNHDIAAVISKPDAPKNRGMKLFPSEVKQVAAHYGIPVFTPEKLKSLDTLDLLSSFNADVFVVVAFGRLLSKAILDIPPMGCVNVHGSLLPKYRGAAPVQWSVLNGDAETGVTTMLLDEGMDTGPMLIKKSVRIFNNETFGELYERLAHTGAELLIETLEAMRLNTVVPEKQSEAEATMAPPVTKEMCRINFNMSPVAINNRIRGLNPSPSASCLINGIRFKLHKAVPVIKRIDAAPGRIVSAGQDGLEIACLGGTLLITELQADGGKRMPASAYLRGHPIA